MSGASERGAPSDPAVVGKVARPHGLAGDIVVAPMDSSASCAAGDTFWLSGSWRRVSRCRVDNKGRWVMRLDGVADRDAAERLRGATLVVEADELPALGEGHYYIHDLVGCRVLNPAGDDLGEVVAVVPGPQDWLEVECDGARSLVPMARALLQEVDVPGRRIVIDPPPGLAEATRG